MIGSSEQKVLSIYGSPDRVVRNSRARMLSYGQRGVLLWVVDGKVRDFTVFRRAAPVSADNQSPQAKAQSHGPR